MIMKAENDQQEKPRKSMTLVSRINNDKKLKIDLIKKTESSMKGRIKEHKKTGNKNIHWRKESKIRFFSPSKKSC